MVKKGQKRAVGRETLLSIGEARDLIGYEPDLIGQDAIEDR
jgi:hypothetical protein